MYTFWVILIILICLFLFISYSFIIFGFGLFFPALFYCDQELYFIWKNGYMPMLKDMKKYFTTNKSFKKYNFKEAIDNYLIKTIKNRPEIEKQKKNDK